MTLVIDYRFVVMTLVIDYRFVVMTLVIDYARKRLKSSLRTHQDLCVCT
jgi:hypothetical protein